MGATTVPERPKLPVVVEKPTPYTFDLGLLLANDANPVVIDRKAAAAQAEEEKSEITGSSRVADAVETQLAAVARDGAQALVNQLLTTCRIEKAAGADGGAVLLNLPPVTTSLPREKPVPQPKPPTKWEQFAAKKGIKPKTREQRRNLQHNAETGAWERKWGYGGANKAGEDDWLVELKTSEWAKDAEHAANGTSVRGEGRRERKERVRRNERKMRRNEAQAQQGKR